MIKGILSWFRKKSDTKEPEFTITEIYQVIDGKEVVHRRYAYGSKISREWMKDVDNHYFKYDFHYRHL